jgi:LasA protease
MPSPIQAFLRALLTAGLLLSSCTLLPSAPAPDAPSATAPEYTRTASPALPTAVPPANTPAPVPLPAAPASIAVFLEPPVQEDPPQPAPPPDRHGWLPDSEVVYSPAALGFDLEQAVQNSCGALASYRQYLTDTRWNSAAQVLERVALENSVNPRLLLGLLQYQSGCFPDGPALSQTLDYSLGGVHWYRKDLYGQLVWAVEGLEKAYYARRAGTLDSLLLADGTLIPLDTGANPGTAAVLGFFARLNGLEQWQAAVHPESGFPAFYIRLFGDPWERAVEPLLPAGLAQPALTLPFAPGLTWNYTGGPHFPWEDSGPLAALDFAPPAPDGCRPNREWVTAPAAGIVVRSERGVLTLDLDGDGLEQTGWVLLFLHLADKDRPAAGTVVQPGDRLGHASCTAGQATGLHVHIARKYNGEWIPAAGDLAFTLDGWMAVAGAQPYQGLLVRENQQVTAHINCPKESQIRRDE